VCTWTLSTSASTATWTDPPKWCIAARIDGRDRRAAEVLDTRVARLLGDGRLEPAGTEPELEQLVYAGTALSDEVLAGDAAVDDPVLDVLGDIGRSHQQDVDRGVPAGKGERPLAGLFRPEAGVLQKGHRGLA